MAKKTNGFRKAATSKCGNQAHVHVGVLGKGHRGCGLNATKLQCVWVGN